MFTGIVTAIGTIEAREERGDLRLTVRSPLPVSKIAIGASLACAGTCLTVVEKWGDDSTSYVKFDISAETLSRTARGTWAEGAQINLEPSLRLGDELGGHIVAGHVDAVGTVVSREAKGGSTSLVIAAPRELAPFLAEKGSVTVDGVSLTVNRVEDQADGSVHFGLNIIPHTAEVTTLGGLCEADEVNLEIDTVARYLQRLEALRAPG